VTLFGAAARFRCGRDQLPLARELLAAGASEDLAYTVGFEHKTVHRHGDHLTVWRGPQTADVPEVSTQPIC
jgi:hypothetical protein